MSEISLGFNLDLYPTLKAAAASEALVRLIKGPAGSGKTSWAIMELFRTALLQEPSALDNTRYTRMLVIRNTYSLLKSNTIPSMKNMFGPILQITEGSQPTGKVRVRLTDGTDVHMDIQFLALDSEDAQDKLLGSEPTMVLCDELNMMQESVVFSLVRRLGRYPSGTKGKVTRTGIIGVFNGPVKGSWLHKWWLGERDKEFEQTARQMGIDKFVEFFSQPAALLRPDTDSGDWLPNPLAENIHNLAQGYGYYYAMLADPDKAKIQAYVEGDFADVKHGKVVFPEFHRDVHTFPATDIDTKQMRNYYLSFDFGRTPVCIVGYLAHDGSLIILDEFMGSDMSVDTLYQDIVRPALRERYPNATCLKAWGDPAGNVKGQNLDLSPFDVLRGLGVPIVMPSRNNKIEPRLEAVRRFMGVLGAGGKPRLRIRDNCRFLVQAMAADYIYERSGNTVKSEPTKSHENWVSDLCLAAGTLIATPKGNIRIEDIKVGDEVYTRNGVRKVLASEMTNTNAEVFEYDIGGICVTATPNHPVFANGAFHAIDTLVGNSVYCNVSNYADIIECEQTRLLKTCSLLMDGVSQDTQETPITGGKLATTHMNGIEKGGLFLHTNMFGKNKMGLFRKGIRYTTKTTTLRTILLRTLNLWKQKLTLRITQRNDLQRMRSLGSDSMPQASSLPQRGINPKQGVSGIESMLNGLPKQSPKMVLSRRVLGAVRNLLALPPTEKKVFVECLAKAQPDAQVELMTNNALVPSAEKYLPQTNTPRKSFAPRNVCVQVSRGKCKNAIVYNLTVEQDNEYYANGVLVHNCDSLQYMALGMLRIIADGDDDEVVERPADINWFA